MFGGADAALDGTWGRKGPDPQAKLLTPSLLGVRVAFISQGQRTQVGWAAQCLARSPEKEVGKREREMGAASGSGEDWLQKTTAGPGPQTGGGQQAVALLPFLSPGTCREKEKEPLGMCKVSCLYP